MCGTSGIAASVCDMQQIEEGAGSTAVDRAESRSKVADPAGSTGKEVEKIRQGAQDWKQKAE